MDRATAVLHVACISAATFCIRTALYCFHNAALALLMFITPSADQSVAVSLVFCLMKINYSNTMLFFVFLTINSVLYYMSLLLYSTVDSYDVFSHVKSVLEQTIQTEINNDNIAGFSSPSCAFPQSW